MVLIVCPLRHVAAVVKARRPSHLITLLGPEEMIETPQGIAADRHLKLGVHDIADAIEGLVAPDETTVARIVGFGAGWDAAQPMVVHCWAGISRSTATAFILACERNPETAERDIAWTMRRAAPHAYPNRRLVRLADDLLGRRGRMADAVEEIGASSLFGVIDAEGVPFDLPVRYG